jgi:hypothetical protein
MMFVYSKFCFSASLATKHPNKFSISQCIVGYLLGFPFVLVSLCPFLLALLTRWTLQAKLSEAFTFFTATATFLENPFQVASQSVRSFMRISLGACFAFT